MRPLVAIPKIPGKKVCFQTSEGKCCQPPNLNQCRIRSLFPPRHHGGNNFHPAFSPANPAAISRQNSVSIYLKHFKTESIQSISIILQISRYSPNQMVPRQIDWVLNGMLDLESFTKFRSAKNQTRIHLKSALG